MNSVFVSTTNREDGSNQIFIQFPSGKTVEMIANTDESIKVFKRDGSKFNLLIDETEIKTKESTDLYIL